MSSKRADTQDKQVRLVLDSRGRLFGGMFETTRCFFSHYALNPAWHEHVGRLAVIGGEPFITWPHSWLGWSASCCLACVVWTLESASLLSNQTKFGVRSPRAVLHPSVCHRHTDSRSVGITGSNSGLSDSHPPVSFKLFESSFFQHSSQLFVIFFLL